MFDMTGEQVRKMKGNYNYFLDTSVIQLRISKVTN